MWPFHRQVFVAPVIAQTGVASKIWHALYLGLPVVTTESGLGGLLLESPNPLIEAKNFPDEFARAVVNLCSDALLWTEVSSASIRFIAKSFSHEAFTEDLAAALAKLPVVPSTPKWLPQLIEVGIVSLIVVFWNRFLLNFLKSKASTFPMTKKVTENLVLNSHHFAIQNQALEAGSAYVCTDADYRGMCQQLVQNSGNFDDSFAGDISSIAMGSGGTLVLFRNIDMIGPCLILWQSEIFLGDWNDDIRSYRFYSSRNPMKTGEAVFLSSTCQGVKEGDYSFRIGQQVCRSK